MFVFCKLQRFARGTQDLFPIASTWRPIGTGHYTLVLGSIIPSMVEIQHSIYLFRLVGAVSIERVEGIPTDRWEIRSQ